MTKVRGVLILAAPCCGARYAFPRYMSMNFSAFEYWTDGWREHSLMPNDEGLRLCQCGQFVLLKNMLEVDAEESSELPFMDHVSMEMLPDCIAQAVDDELEVAARLEYWRHLNHGYRDRYRLHRDAEDATTKAAWVAANPDKRTWWDKLWGRKPPVYSRPPDGPLTCPIFEPTDEQLANMKRLSEILLDWRAASRGAYNYSIELAELYREQGRFQEAASVIQSLAEGKADVTSQLIAMLIKQQETAPMRYRM